MPSSMISVPDLIPAPPGPEASCMNQYDAGTIGTLDAEGNLGILARFTRLLRILHGLSEIELKRLDLADLILNAGLIGELPVNGPTIASFITPVNMAGPLIPR